MRVRVVQAPGMEPISIQELKNEIRQTSDQQDDMLLRQITSVRQHLEKTLGNAYITQGLEGTLSRFYPIIDVARPPLQTVESITYIDMHGNQQTVDSEIYGVDPSSNPGTVYLRTGKQWPDTQPGNPATVRINYTAGYGDNRNDVPQDIRGAMLMLAATIYYAPALIGAEGGSKVPTAVYEGFLSNYANF